MKNLLAIGNAAANVVKQLSQYPVYNCYYITNEIKKTSKYRLKIPTLPGPEEYELMDMTKLHSWIEKIEGSVTVFVNGGSDSSGLILPALEKLYNRGTNIDIVYFMPEIDVMSDTKRLHERAARGILQNFARSGLFDKICMVSNLALEAISGPTSVYEYFDQINQVFTSSYYMVDVFKNTKPITCTFKKPKESCRITTIGLSSLEEEDRLFFPFKQEVDVVYYYGLNENRLKTEENLFRSITNRIKSKITEETKVSFGIFQTQYEGDYIYTEYFSPKIQQLVVDKK